MRKRAQAAMPVALRQQPRSCRGQAAMEFLMTYGWAILVIIIVVAVLFYMGVLNPKSTQTSTCMFAPGHSCYSFLLANGTGELSLDFGQALGKSVMVTGISCSQDPNAPMTTLDTPIVIPSGEHSQIAGPDSGITCKGENNQPLGDTDTQLGERYKGRVCVAYTEMDTNTPRTVCGDLNGKFEVGTGGGGGGGTPTPTPTGTATETPAPTPTPTPTPAPTPPACASGYVVNSCPCTLVPGDYVLDSGISLSSGSICILIPASNTTLDCRGHSVTGPSVDYNYGILVGDQASDVSISNCVVSKFTGAIYVQGTRITVTGNTATQSSQNGIFVHVTTDSTITNNIANSNNYDGIQLQHPYTHDNTVTGNTANSNGECGIRIWQGAYGINLAHNTVSSNSQCGINLGGVTNGNTFTDNIATSNPTDFICDNADTNNDNGNTCNTQSGCSIPEGGWLHTCPPPTPIILASGQDNPYGIAVDGSSVYFAEWSSGNVDKVPIGGGDVTTLASGLDHPLGIAVDGSSVYSAEYRKVDKVPIGGGSVTVLASGLNDVRGIAVDGSSVYFTEQAGGRVSKVPIIGGDVTILASGLNNPYYVAVDGSNVYFTEWGSGNVDKVPIGGGSVTVLASGLNGPQGIAVDGSNIYFTEINAGKVDKVPIGGGSVTVLASGFNTPQVIAVDGSNVYFTDQVAGNVYKLPK